jgi:transposase
MLKILVMTMKNKYYNRSRISEAKFREIIKYFVLDLNATQITTLTNLNRNTINKVLYLIRQRILLITQLQSALP